MRIHGGREDRSQRRKNRPEQLFLRIRAMPLALAPPPNKRPGLRETFKAQFAFLDRSLQPNSTCS